MTAPAPGGRGATTVAGRAVRRIASAAAAEALPGRAAAVGTVSAAVRGREAVVSLGIALPAGAPVARSARLLRDHVSARTGELTGLDVSVARVGISALTSPPPGRAHDGTAAVAPADWGARPTRRDLSPRRLPATLSALLAAMVCAAGAVWAASLAGVRPGESAGGWYASAVDAVDVLPGHGPGDRLLPVFGGALVVLGLVLLWAAVAPGHRGRLSALSPAPGSVAVSVDRAAVARRVGDVVSGVPGVDGVTVRVRRRRAAVRARLAFGDRDSARRAVTDTAAQALAGSGLGRVPRVRVTVTPGPARSAPATEESGSAPGPGTAAPADGSPSAPGPSTAPDPSPAPVPDPASDLSPALVVPVLDPDLSPPPDPRSSGGTP
ncbi:DUF6286 domain-containing protein [Streptomyces sp. NPDC005805]|uniref:DUF6286 domain-containing protein n=1 Tax=Streptomyces sp. NPDC005805 TaxID=3157068 RepID=UPI0033E26FB7